MSNDCEFIDVDDGECQEIKKNINNQRYDFPAVAFSDNGEGIVSVANVNTIATALFGDTERLKIKFTANYIMFIPSKEPSDFKLIKAKTRNAKITSTKFNSTNLRNKVFKLYRFKDGFLIKRNEPIMIKERKDQ